VIGDSQNDSQSDKQNDKQNDKQQEEIEFLQGLLKMKKAHQEALEEKEEKLRQELSRLDAIKKSLEQ